MIWQYFRNFNSWLRLNSAAQGSTGTKTASIVVPTILAFMLILALVIVAGLGVFVCKRRRKLPTELSSVIYTNNNGLDNPTYIGSDLLGSTKVSDLHFDPRGIYDDDKGGHYMTIPSQKEIDVSLNSLANSTKELIKEEPPHYSTLEHN